jgi:hypothetical protein
MSIPKDIVEKYNFLKQNTFEALGLPFHPGTPQVSSDSVSSPTGNEY